MPTLTPSQPAPQSGYEMDLNQWLLYLVPTHLSQGCVTPVFKRSPSVTLCIVKCIMHLYVWVTCSAHGHSVVPYAEPNLRPGPPESHRGRHPLSQEGFQWLKTDPVCCTFSLQSKHSLVSSTTFSYILLHIVFRTTSLAFS